MVEHLPSGSHTGAFKQKKKINDVTPYENGCGFNCAGLANTLGKICENVGGI